MMRVFRMSPVFQASATKFENRWKLLGDTAYIAADFSSIVTP